MQVGTSNKLSDWEREERKDEIGCAAQSPVCLCTAIVGDGWSLES